MNGSATPTWLDQLPAPPLFYVLHPDTPEQDAQPGRTDRSRDMVCTAWRGWTTSRRNPR